MFNYYRDDTYKKSNNKTTNSSVPSAAAPRSFNGTNRSETVSHLMKMSNRGYGNPTGQYNNIKLPSVMTTKTTTTTKLITSTTTTTTTTSTNSSNKLSSISMISSRQINSTTQGSKKNLISTSTHRCRACCIIAARASGINIKPIPKYYLEKNSINTKNQSIGIWIP